MEASVGLEDFCNRSWRDADRIADGADLVGKSNLERMKRVACVLDHLRRCNLRLVKTGRQKAIQLADRGCLERVAGPNDGKGRIKEIRSGGALAEELRIETHEEGASGFLSACGFDCRAC